MSCICSACWSNPFVRMNWGDAGKALASPRLIELWMSHQFTKLCFPLFFPVSTVPRLPTVFGSAWFTQGSLSCRAETSGESPVASATPFVQMNRGGAGKALAKYINGCHINPLTSYIFPSVLSFVFGLAWFGELQSRNERDKSRGDVNTISFPNAPQSVR